MSVILSGLLSISTAYAIEEVSEYAFQTEENKPGVSWNGGNIEAYLYLKDPEKLGGKPPMLDGGRVNIAGDSLELKHIVGWNVVLKQFDYRKMKNPPNSGDFHFLHNCYNFRPFTWPIIP